MAIVRCQSGEHQYDDTKYTKCPYCTIHIQKGIKDMNQRDTSEKTQTYPGKSRVVNDKTDPTLIIQNDTNANATPNKDPKTTGTWGTTTNSAHNIIPVTGWLVILDGDFKGKDYRITPGINTIGRSINNSIAIEFDSAISRERHCIVEYDYKNKKFYIEKDSNSVYLNDERVGGDGKELKPNDIIEIGNTKLMFIPFCTTDFCWEM